jgi:hypothetical protein
MSLTQYPALGHLALQNCYPLSAAGSELTLLFADTCLYQPNIIESEQLLSQCRAPEPLPVLIGPVRDIDAATAEARCVQLFSELLQAHPALVSEVSEHTLLLCPESAKPLLASIPIPVGFGQIHWAHQLEDGLQILEQLLTEQRDQISHLNWLSVDSLLDYEAYQDCNADFATDRNPEGVIPGEGACCLRFSVEAQARGSVQSALEPFAFDAETEPTTALNLLLGEQVPTHLVSNRSSNSNAQIAEWYRILGKPAPGLAHLSTRQSLGDTGLNETALVLALALAKVDYDRQALAPCLIFQQSQRLYWRCCLATDATRQRNEP